MDLFVKDLHIVNYKNIGAADVACSRRFNCFIGDNGAGKTNVLDAVYHLSMCRSLSRLPDGQCIRHGEEFFVLTGRYDRGGEEVEVYCGMKRGGRKVFKRNRRAYERLSEHIGLLPLVVVSPGDAVLIDGGGEERRHFVDGVISQCDGEYLQHLIRYNRVLLQRNALLKEYAGRRLDGEMLGVWDEQLARHGEEVLRRRRAFVEAVEGVFQGYYERLSGGRERVGMSYVATMKGEDYGEALREARERDRLLTYTTVGVHRDDVALTLGGYPVKRLGSQGQKKSFLTALKFAQFVYLSREMGVTPLLLLDDLFDKLDAGRVAAIVDIVGGEGFGQVFITDTNRQHVDELLKGQGTEYNIFRVHEGEVG